MRVRSKGHKTYIWCTPMYGCWCSTRIYYVHHMIIIRTISCNAIAVMRGARILNWKQSTRVSHGCCGGTRDTTSHDYVIIRRRAVAAPTKRGFVRHGCCGDAERMFCDAGPYDDKKIPRSGFEYRENESVGHHGRAWEFPMGRGMLSGGGVGT